MTIKKSTFLYSTIAWIFLIFHSFSEAHPMPGSLVFLDIRPDGVAMEMQLPMNELELAFGHDLNQNPEEKVARFSAEISAYLIEHIRPTTLNESQNWSVSIENLEVKPAEQGESGPYNELVATAFLKPPTGAEPTNFMLNYDVIIHQVVTHWALVKIRNNWSAGVSAENPVEIGTISMDFRTSKVAPLKIEQHGSLWTGFKSMVKLGAKHIAEGTDHLLFLLVLILAAPLISIENKRWKVSSDVRFGLIRLLKIVTAFTIGHSITLILGALNWVQLPQKPIEVLIAFSIFISAVHLWRPIFPNKEMFVAAFFGLIHGLAFANSISNLNLSSNELAFSIFGFNLGIELFQICAIGLLTPLLIFFSRNRLFTPIRIVGSLAAMILSIFWIGQRLLI